MTQLSKERANALIENLDHYATNLKWQNVKAAQDLLVAADGLRELLVLRERYEAGITHRNEQIVQLIRAPRELEPDADISTLLENVKAALLELQKCRLLAAEAREPVGEIIERKHPADLVASFDRTIKSIRGFKNVFDYPVGTKLYAAPPAPVAQPVQVPELKSLENLEHKPLSKSYREGWNACCTAMLKGDE